MLCVYVCVCLSVKFSLHFGPRTVLQCSTFGPVSGKKCYLVSSLVKSMKFLIIVQLIVLFFLFVIHFLYVRVSTYLLFELFSTYFVFRTNPQWKPL